MQGVRRFLLKDDYYKQEYGVLSYEEECKHFSFEIKSGYPLHDYPPIIQEAVRRGYTSLPQEYMRMFISNRLIPPNRQNIVDILRSAGLKTYDNFGMLLYTMGRCCQDEMYLQEISEEQYNQYNFKVQ